MAKKKTKKQIKRKKNYSLDCMRGVACLFVVLIHCPLPGVPGEILRSIGRFAVPFFVLISGYYWYKEDDEQRFLSTEKALGNIVKLTALGTIFCVLANTAGCLVVGKAPFYWFTSVFSGQMVWEFLFFNRAAFLSSVMYYLFGMIYTYVLILWLDGYGLMKWGVLAAPVLLVMNILFGTFFGAPWYCSGNWLFTCVPFFLVGYFLRIKGSKLVAKKTGIWVGCLVAGVAVTLLEMRLFGDLFCGVGTVLLAVAIFVLCQKRPGWGQKYPNLTAWICRLSVGVFLVHCTFRDVLTNLCGDGFAKGYLMMPAVLVISVVFTLCVCLFYDKVMKKKTV